MIQKNKNLPKKSLKTIIKVNLVKQILFQLDEILILEKNIILLVILFVKTSLIVFNIIYFWAVRIFSAYHFFLEKLKNEKFLNNSNRNGLF